MAVGRMNFMVLTISLFSKIAGKRNSGDAGQFSGAPAATHTLSLANEQSSSLEPPKGIQLLALVTELYNEPFSA